MDSNPRKCLVRWHEYSDSVTVAVQTLRYDEELLDVTLACEGQTIRAHKLVLAASSQYFRQVLKDFPCEHPTIVIDGIQWKDLVALLQFMYYGQVLVEEEAVLSLLTAASSLAVIGLSYVTAALTHAKLTPPDSEPQSPRDNLTPTGESAIARDTAEDKDPPTPLSVPLNLGTKDPAPQKDGPSLNSSNKDTLNASSTTTTSSFLRSFSSHEPNILSVVTAKKTDSVEPCSSGPAKKPTDLEATLPTQPQSKRAKTVCENDPPDTKARTHRQDHFWGEESARRGCHENGAPDPHRVGLDKEDSRRNHALEKVLSERKLNAENVGGGAPSGHPLLNGGDSPPSSKAFDERDYLDSELSQESASPENGDPDLGPAPLPLNHPAVLAASSSVAAAAAVSYAALLAANTRGGTAPSGIGNGSPLHSNVPSPSGVSLPVWMPPTSNASPSPSPPAAHGFIHPPGMSQQDLQATLEQYQRKLAFHEPRPCPTCKRMYRDAATLRTHIAIMHSEGKEPFGCTCGALFRTKYDMYQHKKNGHR